MSPKPEATPSEAPETAPAPAAPLAGARPVWLRCRYGVGVLCGALPLDFRESATIEVPEPLALEAIARFPDSFAVVAAKDAPTPALAAAEE